MRSANEWCIATSARASVLAVDAQDHLGVEAVELVCRRDAGAEDVRAVPVLGLGRAHAERQLARLGVARRHVVPDRPAEDVLARSALRDVAALGADHAGELELVSSCPSSAATGSRPRARSRCRAGPCSTQAPRTTASGIVRDRGPASRAFMWPSNVRKSRSVRGRNGARSRAPATGRPLASAARAPARSPPAISAVMSPSKPTSTTSSPRRTPTRGAVPAPRSYVTSSTAHLLEIGRDRLLDAAIGAAAAEVAVHPVAHARGAGAGVALPRGPAPTAPFPACSSRTGTPRPRRTRAARGRPRRVPRPS